MTTEKSAETKTLVNKIFNEAVSSELARERERGAMNV